MILSLTLEASCLQARKALIDALFRLFELATDEDELALARQSPPAASDHGQAGAGDRAPWEFSRKRAAPSKSERREQLRQQVMQLGKVRHLSEQSPEVFNRLLDRVFSEVETGELPAAAVTGKILDLVYAESSGTPDTEAAAHPHPPEPASTAESASKPSKPEVAAPPAGHPPIESPPADSPDIPERLGNWAAQGLAANRLFRQLKNQGDLEPRIIQWKQDGQAGTGQTEQKFVHYFLQQVSHFTIDDQAFSFELPDSIGPMDCSSFEMLIEQGKETGVCGIDRRIWGVVGTAFLFLKNAFAPQLGIDAANLGNRGKAAR